MTSPLCNYFFFQLDVLCNDEILGKDHTLKFLSVTRWKLQVYLVIKFSVSQINFNSSIFILPCVSLAFYFHVPKYILVEIEFLGILRSFYNNCCCLLYFFSRLLYLAYSANLALLCMPHPGMGPLV